MAKKSFFERLVGATEEIRKNRSGKEEMSSLRRVDFGEPKKNSLHYRTSAKKNPKPAEEAKTEPIEEERQTEEEGQLTIDVYQTGVDIVIKSTVAGTRSEDIDISITDSMITIKGRRIKDEKIEPENYYYQELYWGPFSRSVVLPIDIDADKTKASIKDGILTIKLPKIEKLKTKVIKVREIE